MYLDLDIRDAEIFLSEGRTPVFTQKQTEELSFWNFQDFNLNLIFSVNSLNGDVTDGDLLGYFFHQKVGYNSVADIDICRDLSTAK